MLKLNSNLMQKVIRMAKKEITINYANFNITFDQDIPLLEHFEDIIYPAFCSNDLKSLGDPKRLPAFYLNDVKVLMIDNEYILTGNYILATEYDVHTQVQDGALVKKDFSVSTAPYSRFIIFLQNHRMVFARNESASPSVRSFQKTVRFILQKYVGNYNRKLKDKSNALPSANVNIVDIPLKGDIEEFFKTIKKVDLLKLSFFPLNNDLNPFAFIGGIDQELKKIEGTSANLSFNSPESISEVKNVIQKSAGLAKTTLECHDEKGTFSRVKEDNFSSSKKIPFARDITEEDIRVFTNQAKRDEITNSVSPENRTLYKKYINLFERLSE